MNNEKPLNKEIYSCACIFACHTLTKMIWTHWNLTLWIKFMLPRIEHQGYCFHMLFQGGEHELLPNPAPCKGGNQIYFSRWFRGKGSLRKVLKQLDFQFHPAHLCFYVSCLFPALSTFPCDVTLKYSVAFCLWHPDTFFSVLFSLPSHHN